MLKVKELCERVIGSRAEGRDLARPDEEGSVAQNERRSLRRWA